MDTYTILRQIADSWMLIAMFAFFVGVISVSYTHLRAHET